MPPVSVVYPCADARRCKAPRDAPRTVVLGAHHSRTGYRFLMITLRAKTLCRAAAVGWLAPPIRRVLYNVETQTDETLLKDIFPRWALEFTLGTTRGVGAEASASRRSTRGTSCSGGLHSQGARAGPVCASVDA